MALSASFPIKSLMPWELVSTECSWWKVVYTGVAYLRHYWLSFFILHISEGHLRALVVVDLQVRMIHIGNILQGNYMMVSISLEKEATFMSLEHSRCC